MFEKGTIHARLHLIALIFLPIHFLSFTGELVHSWIAPHTICAEHLEIVDAPAVHHDRTLTAFTIADESSGEVAHEHCAFFQTSRKTANAGPATRVAGQRDDGFALAIPRVVPPIFATEPRYRLAPKNSPPA